MIVCIVRARCGSPRLWAPILLKSFAFGVYAFLWELSYHVIAPLHPPPGSALSLDVAVRGLRPAGADGTVIPVHIARYSPAPPRLADLYILGGLLPGV